MNRRRFLHLTSIGAFCTTVPSFLGCSRAGGQVFANGLAGELEKARAGGKPLLVFVIPPEEDAREIHARGELFGSYLNHSEPEGMAPLALAHVVCARAAELRAVLGDAAPTGEPLMVLIETDGATSARAIDPTLAAMPTVDWSSDLPYEEQLQRIDAAYSARNASLGEVVRDALIGDRTQRTRRAGACVAVLTDAEVTRLKEASDVASLGPDLVDRGAAWLAEEALDAEPARRAAIESALAAAAMKRLREVPPPGAHWATNSGCGFEIEGQKDEERVAIACGMGFTPELGRRFLYFFSER